MTTGLFKELGKIQFEGADMWPEQGKFVDNLSALNEMIDYKS